MINFNTTLSVGLKQNNSNYMTHYSTSQKKNFRMNWSLMVLLLFSFFIQAQERDTMVLWKGKVPGEAAPKQKAVISSDTTGNVVRLTDITNPSLVVYEPTKERNNGAGIIVCPGGGYEILAVDKEGYEVAQWLSELGYTAFVLKYRVPQKQEGALMDAQRAMRLVRGNADKWDLDQKKIGIMGFSAGGSLSVRASTLYNKDTYPHSDTNDELSARPDFAALIYPAYLDKGENRSLTPELKVDSETPPMFVFGTADDKYGNSSLVIAGALRDNQVPVELHFLSTGGHGYGMRKGNKAAETWPTLLEEWLKINIKSK